MNKPERSHPFHIHIPDKTWAEFKKLAKKNRRTLKEEALIAVENHVKAGRGIEGAK